MCRGLVVAAIACREQRPLVAFVLMLAAAVDLERGHDAAQRARRGHGRHEQQRREGDDENALEGTKHGRIVGSPLAERQGRPVVTAVSRRLVCIASGRAPYSPRLVTRTRAMGLLHATLAALLLVIITPGATELVEDVVHFLVHGDTLHDDAHGDAHHCCSGAFHVCGCHPHQTATPVVPERFAFERDVTWSRDAWPTSAPSGGPSDAHDLELSRPPAA